MTEQRSELMGEFAGLLRQLGMAMREHIHSTLDAYEMTPPQAWALKALEGPCHMGQLADRLGFDKSYVTGLADGLEQRGLVERQPDPADRRARNLVLTDAGREMQARIEGDVMRNLPIGAELSEPELTSLIALLAKALPE